ncbi:MAG: hypothetical protein AAF664_04210 [Planctomycetota bacterium]
MSRVTLGLFILLQSSFIAMGDEPIQSNTFSFRVEIPTDDSGKVAPKGRVRIPVIHNVMEDARIFLDDQGDQRTQVDVQTKVHPEVDHWWFQWSGLGADDASKPLVGIVSFADEGDGSLVMRPRVVSQRADMTVSLRACDASVSGKLLRYEPQPHKNTVGYWANADDTVTWMFEVREAGTYNLAILQGCGAEKGGSTVRAQLAGSSSDSCDFQVEETGHFQNFVWRTVGALELQAGVSSLTFSCVELANIAVGDFRQVELTLVRP